MKRATSGKSAYWQKLKDPRWQKKRLEVMQAAGFVCESCGDSETTLNVHHKAYKKNSDPWEYGRDELQCLCEDCHQREHDLDAMLADALYAFKTESIGIGLCKEQLIGYLQAAFWGEGPDREWLEIFSYEHALGVAQYCGYSVSQDDEANGLSAADVLCSFQANERGRIVINRHSCDWIFKHSQMKAHVFRLLKSEPDHLKKLEGYGFFGWPDDVVAKYKEAAKEFFSLKDQV